MPPAALHERPQILEQLGKITAIKGHPLVTDLVLQCCHSKEWQERLKAVQVLPAIVFKGDPVAVGVLIGRLLDWHLEVCGASFYKFIGTYVSLSASLTCIKVYVILYTFWPFSRALSLALRCGARRCKLYLTAQPRWS